MKVCPVLVQLYWSRHQLDSRQWFPKSRTSLNPDKIHLVEKDNSKSSKSICKSIGDFYDTGNTNRYQLTKLYKIAVPFVLRNAEFSTLSTVLSYIQLRAMLSLINIYLIQLL